MFDSITEIEFFKIFLYSELSVSFNEWTTPTAELPATVVVALHHGKNHE